MKSLRKMLGCFYAECHSITGKLVNRLRFPRKVSPRTNLKVTMVAAMSWIDPMIALRKVQLSHRCKDIEYPKLLVNFINRLTQMTITNVSIQMMTMNDKTIDFTIICLLICDFFSHFDSF